MLRLDIRRRFNEMMERPLTSSAAVERINDKLYDEKNYVPDFSHWFITDAPSPAAVRVWLQIIGITFFLSIGLMAYAQLSQ